MAPGRSSPTRFPLTVPTIRLGKYGLCRCRMRGGGSAATGTIAIAGTATANGTLFIYIGCGPAASGAMNDLLAVGVTSGQTATQIGASIAAAVAAQYGLPVSAVNSSGPSR